MGYETRLFVIEKWEDEENADIPTLGEVIASYDLCKFGEFSHRLREKGKPIKYGFYCGKRIEKDEYGSVPIEIPLKDAIAVLEEANEKLSYRRVSPLLKMLKGFEEEKARWQEIVVVHYGH